MHPFLLVSVILFDIAIGILIGFVLAQYVSLHNARRHIKRTIQDLSRIQSMIQSRMYDEAESLASLSMQSLDMYEETFERKL